MRTVSCLLMIIPLFMLACENDKDSNELFLRADTDKLLICIMQGGQTSAAFTYDDQNRLVRVDRYQEDTINYSDSFEYDSSDKLVKKTSETMTFIYQYNSAGEMISMKQTYTWSEHEWVTEFTYDQDRIVKGITYYNGGKNGYIEYKYDARGNTIERNEYAELPGETDFMLTTYEFEYDDKINPLPFTCGYPIDIIQYNNPTFSHYSSAVMCSIPPEYTISYDYNEKGLPVREYRQSSYSEKVEVFDYIYSDLE